MFEITNNNVTDPVAIDDKEGRLAQRSKIDTYEVALKDLFGSDRGEMDEINDNGLKEHFVNGTYTRELFIPEGVTIVSKLWNRERLWIIAQGEVTFTTELGVQRVKAPYTAVAPAGSKVALYAHEDTLWFAITGIEEHEIENAEESVSAKDYSECTYPWDQIEQENK